MSFYVNGISATMISASTPISAGSNPNDDVVTFNIRFKVTAFDNDVYIPKVISDSSASAILVSIDKAGTPISTTQFGAATSSILNDDNADTSANNNYIVHGGASETFTATVVMTDGVSGLTAGLYRMLLTNIRWNTTDSASAYNNYTFDLGTFNTGYISVN